MRFSLHQYRDDNERRLAKFAGEHWQKTRNFMLKLSDYSLSEDECADVFQDSLIILWENIKENKVDSDCLDLSNSAYFHQFCKFKTLELLRSRSKYITTSSDLNPDKDHLSYQDEQVEKILSMDDEKENLQKRKEALVRDIVKDLPSPCNELLWGYYGDGHSMKMLAEMFDYASVNAVKVTKHRCCEKFRKRYSEMVKSLF